MQRIKWILNICFMLPTTVFGVTDGEKVFKEYCWGCHHQTAMAFGPPFVYIASQRTKEEIRAMITDPDSASKLFGYKRNGMPSFKLKEEELEAISEYILSYKNDEKRGKK